MICACDSPIPCPDDLTCAKCAKPSVAALTVDPRDVRLHYARRVGFAVTEDEPIEVPNDCDLPCWRHVSGGGQCECEEDQQGTTSDPAGW